ncbi:aspartyl-phosphate phosphatase Spo0E family protein [Alkalibacillus silvisoli]|uniref:Aspartyl-phosphate phosphatase Spo0E family protein n=1 Tax=Alkalibacillus silvisoli TaxID=392823 RepID=A0ABN0ZRI2_9BACI
MSSHKLIEVSNIQSNKKKRLETEIKDLRIKMVKSGVTKGLNHPNTVKLSQELDILLNEYQNLTDNYK